MAMCNSSNAIDPDLSIPNVGSSKLVTFSRCEIHVEGLRILFTGNYNGPGHVLASSAASNDAFIHEVIVQVACFGREHEPAILPALYNVGEFVQLAFISLHGSCI